MYRRFRISKACVWGVLLSLLWWMVGPLSVAEEFAPGWSLTAVLDAELDLASQLEATGAELGPSPVAPAPRMVVGQGGHPSNLSVVRVLSRWGIPETQFLAYPVAISGGVHVSAGYPVGAGEARILCCPISSVATRELRVFDQTGILLAAFEPPADIPAPFVLEMADYLPTHAGEEIALAARHPVVGAASDIVFLDAAGTLLRRVAAPPDAFDLAEDLALSRLRTDREDLVLLSYPVAGRYFLLHAEGAWREIAGGGLSTGERLHASSLEGRPFAAGGPEAELSTLKLFGADGAPLAELDAGLRENRFWVHPIDQQNGAHPLFTFSDYDQGWTANVNSCVIYYDAGALETRFLMSLPFDAYVYAPPATFDGDTYDEFAASITLIDGPPGDVPCALYFFPAAGGVGRAPFDIRNGTQTLRFHIPSTADSGRPAWTGDIDRIRLDFAEGLNYADMQDARLRVEWLTIDATQVTPDDPGNAWTGFVRPARFRHLRTDANSPGYRNPDFENPDYDYWTGGSLQTYIDNTQADYAWNLPSVWEPTFSHRQFVGSFEDWDSVIDSGSGLPKYMALTRLDNRATYSEVGNTFLIMSYAPGQPEKERLLVWPLREYVRQLAPRFRDRPEKLIAIEPTHEFEINIPADATVGDYNPKMIEAFRSWLLRRYTLLAKVNSRFGTAFASTADIDAPRNLGRGAWDTYLASNAYFLEWVRFQKRIVNWRILQGVRETLLAGFPPQAVTTHQIPADYAVGPATDGRITPIEWALSYGGGYGGTRYGIWYDRASNWIQGAADSGHNMITVGEYHPLTSSAANAQAQLQYMFDKGVQFIHHMTWDNSGFNDAGRSAYESMRDSAGRRPGMTGGIGQLRAVHRRAAGYDEARYLIAQIGEGPDRAGLLKSLDANGEWEGSVYVQPFHDRPQVTALVDEQDFTLSDSQWNSGAIAGLRGGDLLEIRFLARSDDAAPKFTLLVLHDGIEIGGQRHVVPLSADWRFYRWSLRIQNPMDSLLILINSGERDTPSGNQQTIELRDFSCLVQRSGIARKENGEPAGQAHGGGLRFDLLSADYAPTMTLRSPFLPASVRGWPLHPEGPGR